MNDLVSIVIPVYNSGRYLRQCLDSVLAQTYPDLEVICVNDGSDDDSPDILNEYSKKDDRIIVLSKENEGKGAASARNLGLSTATGKYIQFLDSDDFFESDMISSLTAKAVNTGADVVICRGQTYDDRKGCVTGPLAHPDLQYAPRKDSFNWRECSEYICEIADFYAWNKMFRRKLLTDNDLSFTPIPIADDQDISMLAPVIADSVAVIDKPFISYRTGSGSSQCDSKTNHPEAAYEGTYSVVKRFRDMGIWEDVKQSYLNVSIRLMREYFDQMTDFDKLRFLYNKYRDEIFPMLDATSLAKDYFHDPRVGIWYELVTTRTLGEVLFESARAYGSLNTTAATRFRVAYNKIPKDGKIVLVGKGQAGRYWYAQLILSGYCDVVWWTNSEDDIPEWLNYDCIIKAE